MIYGGTALTVGLLVLLWYIQPAPPEATVPDTAAAPDAAPSPPKPASGSPCPCDDGEVCFTDKAIPDGICTRNCQATSDCPTEWCCFDPFGAGNAKFYFCAPPEVCKGRVSGVR